MLCDPVSYTGTQPVLAAFPIGSGQLLTIHHLSIDDDMENIYQQFLRYSQGHWDRKGLLERFKTSYRYIALSCTSQAFMANLEMHKATAHQLLPQNYKPLPRDFIIQLSATDWNRTRSSLYAESIHCCLQYFSRYEEVQRILIDTTRISKALIHTIVLPAGFRPVPGHHHIYANYP
jgi:hypothetical protein